MKTLSFFKAALIIAAFAFLSGCQKDISGLSTDNSFNSIATSSSNKPHEHFLKGEFDGGYTVVNGPDGAWYPGTAEGQLNLLGKAEGFVNMYVTVGASGLQGTAAPVNLFFADELSELGITVPDEVAIIFYDKKGNSIWSRGEGGVVNVEIVSPTRATFSGPAEILGGTGKFANASGQYTISGFFNPQDTTKAGMEVKDGIIVY